MEGRGGEQPGRQPLHRGSVAGTQRPERRRRSLGGRGSLIGGLIGGGWEGRGGERRGTEGRGGEGGEGEEQTGRQPLHRGFLSRTYW